MKNSKSISTIAGRCLPVALVAACAAFANPVLAASNSSDARQHDSAAMHADSAHSGHMNASLDDHPVPPKPKPAPHGHGKKHRKHPPHPTVS